MLKLNNVAGGLFERAELCFREFAKKGDRRGQDKSAAGSSTDAVLVVAVCKQESLFSIQQGAGLRVPDRRCIRLRYRGPVEEIVKSMRFIANVPTAHSIASKSPKRICQRKPLSRSRKQSTRRKTPT
uniref:Uncharacterized protein n=1 Tax=Spironucleus salmonicida TaxID=348837 RepID=V6LK95_9EUKA|eukprot:EST44753.1 Hypothetical protein SS50377_15375 [Spironucleus salmonicida]